MTFKKKLKQTYDLWFTKPPAPSKEPEPESKPEPVVKSEHEEIAELLAKFQSGLVIACSEDEVNIYTEAKSEEEALRFLMELTFSNYFVLVYNFIVKKFPEVEAAYVERVKEILAEQEGNQDILELDDDLPLIQPLSLGNPKP